MKRKPEARWSSSPWSSSVKYSVITSAVGPELGSGRKAVGKYFQILQFGGHQWASTRSDRHSWEIYTPSTFKIHLGALTMGVKAPLSAILPLLAFLGKSQDQLEKVYLPFLLTRICILFAKVDYRRRYTIPWYPISSARHMRCMQLKGKLPSFSQKV